MVTFHLSYILASVLLVVAVAGTLYRNGRAFLLDCFGGNEPLTDAVNKMLVVGFIVTKIAYAALFVSEKQTDESIGFLLAQKLGAVLIVLGAMHMFNLLMLSQYRRWRLIPLRSNGGVPRYSRRP